MREDLHEDPAVLWMAQELNVLPATVVGFCHRFWGLVSRQTGDGCLEGPTLLSLGNIIGVPGFPEILVAVGWLEHDDSGKKPITRIPKFERHLSEGAKSRALAAEKKRKQRSDMSPKNGDKCPSESGTRGEESERREEPIVISMGDGTTIGASCVTRGVKRQPSPSDPSPKVLGRKAKRKANRKELGEGEPLDTSEVDWGHVASMAESAGRKVPPRTEDDRRAWLRYAVLAEVAFGEGWLVDAAEAVANAGETRASRQAHFVGVLKSKALDQHGVDSETFVSMSRRIEIPAEVWKSRVLELRK